MAEDVSGGAAADRSGSEQNDMPEELEQQGQGDRAEAQPEAAETASVPRSRGGPDLCAMEDEQFATSIRLRGELGKPAMTGEGSQDELTVRIKVAGPDLSDLHHSLRPYAGRTVQAVILPLRPVDEKLPWETPQDPDQTRLPFEDQAVAGQFVCIACGATCEIGVDGHCPVCGGSLRAAEDEGQAKRYYDNGAVGEADEAPAE